MQIGVDTGGTFTDLVLWDGDQLWTHKVPSTPQDFSRGVLRGLRELSAESGARPKKSTVVHSATVATNALLERKGAVDRILNDEEIIKAKTEPPPDTRARMRGEFIKLARQNGIQYDLDWSNIRLGNLLNVRVICNNPFETDTEKVAELVRTIQKTNLRKTSLSKLVIQS